MKKAMVLMAAMATAMVVASGMAYAASIQCPNRPDNGCEGTKNDARITGTPQPDLIRARAGDDVVKARGGDGDFSIGDGGEDKLSGQAGQDQVIGGTIRGFEDGEDLFFADKSDDRVYGGEGDDPTVAGGYGKSGQDRLYGGEGNDTMYSAQRRFPYRGNVQVNKEMVDCGPGQDVAYIDRGVDEVKDNCERKINGFPDMQVEGGDSLVLGSSGGLFGAGSE